MFSIRKKEQLLRENRLWLNFTLRGIYSSRENKVAPPTTFFRSLYRVFQRPFARSRSMLRTDCEQHAPPLVRKKTSRDRKPDVTSLQSRLFFFQPHSRSNCTFGNMFHNCRLTFRESSLWQSKHKFVVLSRNNCTFRTRVYTFSTSVIQELKFSVFFAAHKGTTRVVAIPLKKV